MICNSIYSFYKYHNIKKFIPFLLEFYYDLHKFSRLRPVNFTLSAYNDTNWFRKEEKSVDTSSMPLLEGNGIKEEKKIKTFAPKKLLAKLPLLLAQITAGKKSV